jgi:membrane fusion protein, copper/silver efflux system
MKRITFYSVLAVGGFAVLIAAASRSGRREALDASNASARKVLYYVDPMHPAYRSDKPGIAPDCGMKLEPVYQEAPEATSQTRDAGDASVRVSPERRALVGVRVETVKKSAGTERLRLYGRVAPEETRVYRVNVGIEGYVREISDVTTGTQVAKDQWLATFSAPEARTAIQSYLVAVDAVANGTLRPADTPSPPDSGLEYAAERLLALGMSRTQIEEIRRTRVVPSTIRIVAPAAGFVIARTLTAGEKITSGQELFQIADLRRVWILADVPGAEAAQVRAGMTAEVSAPGRRSAIRATVSRAVVPQFDPLNQAAKVRLEADNPGFTLRPDMFVDVYLPIALPPAIAVPVDAVLDAGLKKRVFVERADGAFEPREVETGWRFGDRVEIVNGLSDGDRVVVAGTFLLDSESRMRHAAGTTPRP